MKIHTFPLLFIPLLAAFLGWSIQPVAYEPTSKINADMEWPDFAVAQFHKTEDPSFAMNVTLSRSMYAANH